MKKLLLPILVISLLLAGYSSIKTARTSLDLTGPQKEAEVIMDHQDIALADTQINTNLTDEHQTSIANEDLNEDPNEKAKENEKSKGINNANPQPNNEPVKNVANKPVKTNLTQSQNLNKYVLKVISTYKIGNYPYLMNNDYNNYNGVTSTLVYQGRIIAKAHPSRNRACHCSGITFEVFFKAMQQRNRDLGISIDNFNGMTWEELHDFMLTWYVAKGKKSVSNIAVAVEKYGLGRRITNLEEAKAGDFIDFSRENNTGHTAVFINWIRDNGKIIGFKYWSSQESTNGINYKTEYFNVLNSNSKKYGNVNINNVYIARIY